MILNFETQSAHHNVHPADRERERERKINPTHWSIFVLCLKHCSPQHAASLAIVRRHLELHRYFITQLDGAQLDQPVSQRTRGFVTYRTI